MEGWLKSIDLRHWWIAVVAAAIAITTAAIAAKVIPAVLIGLGLLAFGVGEWINHPLQEEVGHGFKLVSYRRRMAVSGALLDVIGLGLVGLGLWRLIAL